MKLNNKQWSLIGLVIALLLASITYRVISGFGASHTGLMFVGLPTILSILLILSGSNGTSPSGQVFKGVTLFLLMVGILAWEGLICIVMAAPLFYLVAFTIQWLISLIKNRSRMYSFATVFIAFMAFEGVHQSFEFERENNVSIAQVLTVNELELLEQISQAPNFDLDLPAFFKMGFPAPVECSATGFLDEKASSAQYKVRFTGPKNYGNELHIRATRIARDEIEFDFVEDSTKVGSWITWKKASLKWAVEGEQVTVIWNVVFQRNLDPYWYFSPVQNYAVKLANHYLLNAWINESNRSY